MADSINYQLAKFVASYGKVSQIPESTCPEVSFVGRSNVGKSSIMNKLFGRKNLVKVSSTPGKTSNINFFEADDVHFVDLPGYGFARRSKAERDRWAELIGDFFDSERRQRVQLYRLPHQGRQAQPYPAGPPSSSHQKAAQRSGRKRDHHKLPDRRGYRRTQAPHRRGLPLVRAPA